MEISQTSSVLIILLPIMLCFLQAKSQGVYCSNPYDRCFQQYIRCPDECPTTGAANSMNRVCYVDCSKPLCNSECRRLGPNCYKPGSACHDPRFIGGDGIVFYFHGKSNEHFSLVSDPDIHWRIRKHILLD